VLFGRLSQREVSGPRLKQGIESQVAPKSQLVSASDGGGTHGRFRIEHFHITGILSE
jgi:hypothetical protein